MRNRQTQRHNGFTLIDPGSESGVTSLHKGFTLIELLVVIAIIAALVAILSVGLQKVKVVATNLKQKGEFHGMDISIELFQNDFVRYPDSAMIYNTGGATPYVCGAQRLAEAMEGRDMRGFHPKSKWHPDLEPAAPNNLYRDATLKERKPVYFELKHTGFYTLKELWGSNTGTLQEDCPVLTDVFVRNPAAGVSEKVGSPVLYFKADPTRKFRVDKPDNLLNSDSAIYGRWIYDFTDNFELLKLAWLREPDVQPNGLNAHYKDPDDAAKENAQFFYEILTQREDRTTNFYKPYNQDRFILISAGWDGIFGTKDDLTNFNY